MPPKKEPVISAFERKRLENIANNNAILSGISNTAERIIPKKPSPAKERSRVPTRPRVKREPVQRETPVATRRSGRLAGIDASDETLKRKLEVEAEAENEKAKAKKMRVSGDLNLGDIAVEGRKWEGGVDGLSLLKGLSVRGAQPGLRTFTDEDVEETTDKELKDIRKRLGGLELYDKWAVNDIKLTPQRIYSMSFHPTEDKPIIFAGDKEGAMGVFDASQPVPKVEDDEDEEADYPDPVIGAFKTHSRTISAFHFSPTDANAVYSASYDSSIRKLDLDKGVSTQVFAPADLTDELPISAIDMATSEPNVIMFSTLHGHLGRHDIRTKSSTAEIWQLAGGSKVGGFSLHPKHPHLVATASLDRTLKIWDLRKIKGSGELRRPALLGEHESRLSVSHASWSAGGHVATSSYDDTIKIYSFPDAGDWKPGADLTEEQMTPVHKIAHNNQTGRWVTILKPRWQRNPTDGLHKFAIGNMNRFVDIYASNGEQLAQLAGEGITAVPAVALFHPTMDWVAGGTASGKLCLWM